MSRDQIPAPGVRAADASRCIDVTNPAVHELVAINEQHRLVVARNGHGWQMMEIAKHLASLDHTPQRNFANDKRVHQHLVSAEQCNELRFGS